LPNRRVQAEYELHVQIVHFGNQEDPVDRCER
jgi:hypothetical protein